MKKSFVKMNIDDKELSLGNFCRLLKSLAVNKSAALQVEVFSCLFDVDSIQDTTVNNYCIGLRSIGDEYKQKYLILKKKYNKDKFIMINICLRIVSILDGNLYFNISNKDGYLLINSNKKIKEFCLKLYNIAKNDASVSLEVSGSIYSKICDGNLYEALVYILFYIILEKKQPVYEEDKKKDVIENLLAQSKISSSDLEDYLKLKFCEGSNYYLSLKKLVNNENAYACFELGCLEYEGNFLGMPRYDIAYSYFLKATKLDHPSSYYYIGRMYFNGNIGSGKDEEKKMAFDYFKRASELGCISAFNSLGLFYLKGIYPVEKDVDTAIKYFKKASSNGYVYAFNNLGLIEEKRNNYSVAFEYFKKSADLGESWACNRVGEYYRKGLYVDKNVTFGDLKGVLNEFIRIYFGASRPTRFRSSFFPFTEPSAEVDVQCIMCEGKGCRTCSGTGWLEVLGCGMVDPHDLEACGIDSNVYTGYAFGMGVERITNLKYRVSDLRLFSENDTRFLREFESAK